MHHWRMMMTFRDKWNHYTVQQTNWEALLISALLQWKTLYFVPIAWQCIACKLCSKCTQTSMKRLRAAYNNAYRIMHYIPRNVSVHPHQVTHCVRTFDAVLRNNLYRLLYDAHLHPTFLSDRFKCLMLVTNPHFSSIIQHSCMETKCSCCPWIVFGVCVSSVLLLCVVKICGHCVHTKHKKVSSGKVSCSSQGWTRTNTGCVVPYSMVIHFLCFCKWRYSCGEDKLLRSSQCWSCANTVSVMHADV